MFNYRGEAIMRHARCYKLTRFALAAVVLVLANPLFAAGKLTAGWIEPVRITPGGIVVDGKLDTGATTSSLDCDCITPHERDGKKWVRFGVRGKGGKVVHLEREVVRKVKIKRHFGQQQERLVVKLGLCIADIYKEVDVTLVDRTGFSYPLLVGRNFLRGQVIVDSDAQGTTTPTCKVPASP